MEIRFQNSNESNNIINYQDYVLSDPYSRLYEIVISNDTNKDVLTYRDASLILESEYFPIHTEIIIKGYNLSKKDLIDNEESRQGYFIKSTEIS